MNVITIALVWTYSVGCVLATQVCNGYAEFCGRSYGVLTHMEGADINVKNVTFIGAHDSAFYSTSPEALSADQHFNVTKQLDDGIRLLQSQGHNLSGSIELCHTSCLL